MLFYTINTFIEALESPKSLKNWDSWGISDCRPKIVGYMRKFYVWKLFSEHILPWKSSVRHKTEHCFLCFPVNWTRFKHFAIIPVLEGFSWQENILYFGLNLLYTYIILYKAFLPAAKPAGLWLANVKLVVVDTWLFGGLYAFRDMLAQVSELARIKYDVSWPLCGATCHMHW